MHLSCCQKLWLSVERYIKLHLAAIFAYGSLFFFYAFIFELEMKISILYKFENIVPGTN